MIKHLCAVLCVPITLLLSSCTSPYNTSFPSEDDFECSTSTGFNANFQMPTIVFINRIDYSRVYDRENESVMTFFDNCGNYYVTYNQDVIFMPIGELIDNYENGSITDDIELVLKSDADELEKIYHEFFQLTRNDNFSLEEFDEAPAVQSSVNSWVGVYFNQGQYEELVFRLKDECGYHEPNDEKASTIYGCIVALFKESYHVQSIQSN